MSLDFHVNLDDPNVHNPKGFSAASAATSGWKNERSVWEFTSENLLPSAIDIVDNTVAPPTEVDGDIYIIDNTGASHVDWDGAAANSWVRYNASDDQWNEIAAFAGALCYIKAAGKDEYYDYNGTLWNAVGSAGAPDTNITTGDLTFTANRNHDLAGFLLTFSGAGSNMVLDNTDGTTAGALTVNSATGTQGSAGAIFQSGGVTKWQIANNHTGGGSSDEFVISTGALDTTHKLVINGTTGFVGLGNNTPDERLEVTGGLIIGSAANTNNGTLQYTGSDFEGRVGGNWLTLTGDGIYKGSGSLSGNTTVTQGANTLDFTTTAVDGFSVDGTTFSVDGSNNRVGIGTAAPVDLLHLFNGNITSENTSTTVQFLAHKFRNNIGNIGWIQTFGGSFAGGHAFGAGWLSFECNNNAQGLGIGAANGGKPIVFYQRTSASGDPAASDEVLAIRGGQVGIGYSGASPSHLLDVNGGINTEAAFRFSGTKVVGARQTGWGAPSGTATRTTFDTSTVTLAALAERVHALIDDLTTHGLIG